MDYDFALDHRHAQAPSVALEQAQLFAHLGTRVTMIVRSQLARDPSVLSCCAA